jgi:hypothetical protein
MEIELIWQIAFMVAAILFLIAMATIMMFYRLSNEYKRRHRDRYFYDYSKDRWVRRKKERKRK